MFYYNKKSKRIKVQKESGEKMEIAPSILSVLNKDIRSICQQLEDINIKYLHLDVMDNKFVPNITFNSEFIKKIRPSSKLIFDTHLMIENPLTEIDKYLNAGSDIITFHLEATNSSDEVLTIIDKIKKQNKMVGISIKPNTDVEALVPYLDKLDLILIMSVEPGFGGQSFIEDVLDKVTYLKEQKNKNSFSYLIEIDGGINNTTIQKARVAGVDIAVVGTFFFKNDDLEKTLKELS